MKLYRPNYADDKFYELSLTLIREINFKENKPNPNPTKLFVLNKLVDYNSS